MKYFYQMSFIFREWITLCHITECFFFSILAWFLHTIFIKIETCKKKKRNLQVSEWSEDSCLFAADHDCILPIKALTGYSEITEPSEHRQLFGWLMTPLGLVMMRATKWQICWVRARDSWESDVKRKQYDEKLWMNVWSCWFHNWQSWKIWVSMWQAGSWLNWSQHPLYSVFICLWCLSWVKIRTIVR